MTAAINISALPTPCLENFVPFVPPVIPAAAIFDENGQPLIDENGNYILDT